MPQQERIDHEKRQLIDDFKALLVKHNQTSMSMNQASLLARQPIEEIRANYERTKAKLEEGLRSGGGS